MSMQDFITTEVKSNPVVVFMKGTPQFPQCGFSGQVAQIMNYLGVDWKGVNVLADEDLRQGVKDFSNWPTVPQVYVQGEFIGGCGHYPRDVPVRRAADHAGGARRAHAGQGHGLTPLDAHVDSTGPAPSGAPLFHHSVIESVNA